MRGWILVIGVVLALAPTAQAIGPNPYNPYDEDPCYCVWGRVEYLYWYLSGAPLPSAVITTGTTGVLGAADTSIVFGGTQKYDPFSGARVSVGGWLDSMGTLGIEGSAMILGQQTSQSTFTSTAAVPLFIPVGTAAVPVDGTITPASQLDFWQANGDFVLTTCRVDCLETNLLSGFQYLNLQEAFTLQQVSTAGVLTGDSIRTNNQFFGGELGARLTVRNYVFYAETVLKVGLGSNYQTVNISNTNGGLAYATAATVGTYTRSVFAVIPQAQLRLGLDLSSHLKTWVGYDFVYISDVARPGAMIDTTSATAPTFQFQSSSFFAHGANIGLELRF